jgi:hypothetical protein
VWYTAAGEMTYIENDAIVSIHPSWAKVGQTEADLMRDELGRLTLALDHPILDLPETTMPCTTSGATTPMER